MSNTERFAFAKITGRQVGLVTARAAEKNLRGRDLLEWLEYECDVEVDRLEDIPAAWLDAILLNLERR
jgi:hypothetical protein